MDQYDVLVVGGGFGGAFAARRLEQLLRDRAERVLLIAAENFFLFSPLLPEAASGTLEPRHAVIPLREFLPNTTVLTGEVASLDAVGRRAKVVDLNGDLHDVAFRALILSPGSQPTTRPIPGLHEHAVGFKTLADAIWLRNHVLRQLEAADATDDLALRRRLLSFTFVGGGYSGVEALAELESLARDAIRRSYPKLQGSDMRWVLVEAADSLLPGLDARLARYVDRKLRAKGIEVHLSTQLTSCIGAVVALSDPTTQPFACGTIVWTAGQRPSALPRTSGFAVDERGRVPVDEYLRVSDAPDTFALGDAAAVPDPAEHDRPCPPTAQHALRQGIVAATNAAACLGVGEAVRFRYRNRGLAVTLGRNQGVAQVKRFTFTGPLAWFMGRSYHLLMMPGIARKSRVVSDWTISLFFPRDVSQLGALGHPSALPPADS
ncbi:MAG TPA: NAD(P)/FAD-dependent oxidoreductase [Acidimicrobiales bacterium]|nr:NAD(P)/FAD-dependent oxidoreductase [Acidimicrobiales bacterium]